MKIVYVPIDFSHFWTYFYTFVLLFLIVFFTLIGWHAVFHIDTSSPFEQKFMDAMLDNQKLVIGALLGLITGAALQKKIDAVPPPEPPKQP